MNLLTDKVKTIYFKYLFAAFASASIVSIYSIVDMAIVGQYQGPDGTAALAVVAPVWNIIYSLGLLTGIGGSVLFSILRGDKTADERTANEFFSASVIGAVLLSLAVWGALVFFEREILIFFGADELLLNYALDYMKPVLYVVPVFLFNRQIMRYLGADALAVYGPIINVGTFVQSCGYSVGQAAQPVISTNFGAKCAPRIKEVLKYALYTAAFFSVFWTALSLWKPNLYVWIFMKPTENILNIAPAIIRAYSLSFLFLPLNIFAIYYFQAIIRQKAAFAVSVLRGIALSGALIVILPAIWGGNAVWYAMPLTETLTALVCLPLIVRYSRKIAA